MLSQTFHKTIPSLAQSWISQVASSLRSCASVIRNVQADVLRIENLNVGSDCYHLEFTWQSFDDIHADQPALFPLLNRPESTVEIAERIAKLLKTSDRLFLPSGNVYQTRFYIPFRVVSSFIWYVEVTATDQGWKVEVREPISRSARCPYMIFRAV